MGKMKRREFLIVGATGVAGLSFVGNSLRAAITAARQTGKPLLTERNLNNFAKTNSLKTEKGRQVFGDAVNNLDSFIDTHFHLTDEQRSELATITPEDRKKLVDAIQMARNKKLDLKVTIVNSTKPTRRMAHPEPLRTSTLSIGIHVFGQFIGIEIKKEKTDDTNGNGNGNKPKPSE